MVPVLGFEFLAIRFDAGWCGAGGVPASQLWKKSLHVQGVRGPFEVNFQLVNSEKSQWLAQVLVAQFGSSAPGTNELLSMWGKFLASTNCENIDHCPAI